MQKRHVKLEKARKRKSREKVKPESRKIRHTSVLSEQQRPSRAFNPAIELENKATKAGFLASAGVAAGDRSREHMQQSLLAWYRESIAEMLPLDEAVRLSMAFGRGYSTMDKRLSGFIPLVLDGTASVVITASNEEKTLPEVISQLRRLPFHEIIVVLNGCTDGSYEAVEDHPSIIKLNYPDRLGHDVGRAIGATAATGDIILFTDGDLPLPAEELAPFIIAINGGDDVALNDLSPYLPPFADQDEVSRSKTFLNQCLGRGDLKANSMTAVPHALSRKAINTIGLASLIVPPKAQALALVYGLKVRAPYTVDVIRNNRIRSSNTGAGNKVARLITGDHIEAFSEVMNVAGIRLAYMTLPRSELARKRNAL